MSLDRERYEKSVLAPARKAGNVPPEDLYLRYGLGPDLPNDAALVAHVAEVVRYWRSLQQKRTWAKLADALLVAHTELDAGGRLTRAALAIGRAEQQERARRRLTQQVSMLAANQRCVSRRTVAVLVEQLGGTVGEAGVLAALRDAKVRIADTVELPSRPPTSKYRDLSGYLATLGLRLSAELVVPGLTRTGFRLLGGFRPAAAAPGWTVSGAVETARAEIEKSRADGTRTAKTAALTILRSETRSPNGFDDLLLWELVEAARPSVEARMPMRTVADVLTELGLIEQDADVIALSLAEGGVGSSAIDLRRARAALEAGELTEAALLVEELPADVGEPLRTQLDARLAQVAALVAEGGRALAAGRAEAAADAYARALRIARDDEDLAGRLARIAPPPPTQVVAVADGPDVALRWTQSDALTGSIRYRVIRSATGPARSASQAVALPEVTGGAVQDRGVPVGRPIHYTVFATRGDDVWSAGSSAEPVVITPDVTDLRVVADARSVSGSWRLPPGATEVVVVRGQGVPPRSTHDGRRIPASDGGFLDRDVRPGTQYHYRVTAVYVTSDNRRWTSPGALASGLPDEPPVPVTDLRAELLGDTRPRVRLSWSDPPGGTVSVRVGSAQPPWPDGDLITTAEVSRHGRTVLGTPRRLAGGRSALEIPLPLGRCFFTATTTTRTRAAVGNTVSLAAVEPVRDLRAQRLADVLQLSWIWPDGSTSAQVRWWLAGGETGAGTVRHCSRRAYEDEGGFRVTVGTGPVTVSVQSIVSDAGEEVCAPPVLHDVPGLPPRVEYGLHRGRWPKRDVVTLELRADRPCVLTDLVLVQSRSRIMPLRVEQGEIVHRLEPVELVAGRPATFRFPVPVPRGPSWLVCFRDGPARGVALVGTGLGDVDG